ncbi:hypothetical protein GCM10022378_16280 [Salinicoccus jeotgali]|uniref:5,10-methylene-tetrahydrofolate dehydrogenase n=1 Tax=Salinicoccus jeotgali TaxID=381634 RepID=A0ABP7F0F7_9STAP
MEKVVVGLITAPGLPEELIKGMLKDLSELSSKHIDDKVDWQFDYQTNPLAASAEFINQTFEKAEAIREDNQWDLAIAISDLPSISSNKIVVSEVNYDQTISLLSVPSLGAIRVKKKLQNLLMHHITWLHRKDLSETPEGIRLSFINQITEVSTSEDEVSNKRYIRKSTVAGWSKLVAGMTLTNEPWTALSNLKTIVALSFATGTYISIFSIPWELSLDYSLWRFVLLTFIAIFGVVGWLIYAHDLWELVSSKNQRSYRYLYNFTTLATLLFITIVNYLVVFLLLVISVVVFVPMGLFETWTKIEPDVEWMDYLNLVWFSASAGVLAGALGSTVEDEGTIQNVTYSYRQMYRYKQIEEENEETTKEEQTEEHAGTKQTHDKSEDD